MSNIQSIIEDAFENRSSITPKSVSKEIKEAIKKFWLLGDFLDMGVPKKHEKLN